MNIIATFLCSKTPFIVMLSLIDNIKKIPSSLKIKLTYLHIYIL